MMPITTVRELEALPDDTVLRTDGGALVEAVGNATFWTTGDDRPYAADEVLRWGVLRVIWRPDAGQTRVMVRCASDGCMDAHALPSGAFYLCPQHRGHITLGRDSR